MKKLVLIICLLLIRGGNSVVGGQISDNPPVITPGNASQVTQLARLGNGTITATAWTPDAQTLAVATSLDIYVYHNGQSNPRIFEDVGFTSGLALSDDGRFLATSEYDHKIRFRAWNLETGEMLTLEDIDPPPTVLKFLPGSSYLLFRSGDSLSVWDAASGQIIRRVPNSFPGRAAMSPDIQYIIGFWKDTQQGSGREFITIIVWDGNTGELMPTNLVTEGSYPFTYMFDPVQNNVLAVVYGNGVVRLWDIETNQLLYALTLPYDLVSTVTFSSDGQILATGGTDAKVRLWEATTGALLEVLPDQPEKIDRLVFSPDGKLAAFRKDEHGLSAWNVRTQEQLAQFSFPMDVLPDLHAISFTASGEQVVAVGGDGTVHFWDVLTGQKQFVWSGGISPDERTAAASSFVGQNVAFSQDRNYLAVRDHHTSALYLWQLDRWTVPLILPTPSEQWGYGMAFSADHHWLVFAGLDADSPNPGWNLWLWEFDEDFKPVEQTVLVSHYTATYANTVFSPTEPVIAYLQDIQEQFGKARLYFHNVETGQVRTIADVKRAGSDLAFSPDGRLLALRQADTLQFWKVDTGTLEYEFGVCGGINALVFSPDGRLVLVSCGLDVELYDTQSGEKLTTLVGHTSYVEAAAFNAAGSLITTTGADGTVRLWGIN